MTNGIGIATIAQNVIAETEDRKEYRASDGAAADVTVGDEERDAKRQHIKQKRREKKDGKHQGGLLGPDKRHRQQHDDESRQDADSHRQVAMSGEQARGREWSGSA